MRGTAIAHRLAEREVIDRHLARIQNDQTTQKLRRRIFREEERMSGEWDERHEPEHVALIPSQGIVIHRAGSAALLLTERGYEWGKRVDARRSQKGGGALSETKEMYKVPRWRRGSIRDDIVRSKLSPDEIDHNRQRLASSQSETDFVMIEHRLSDMLSARGTGIFSHLKARWRREPARPSVSRE